MNLDVSKEEEHTPTSPAHSQRDRARRGYSLLELIVTLGLLALVAVGVFGFYLNGIRAGQHAEGLAAATSLAQGRLEDLRSGLLSEAVSAAQPRATGIPGYAESVQGDEVAPGLRQITVTISWSWRGEARQTTLTTLVGEPEIP